MGVGLREFNLITSVKYAYGPWGFYGLIQFLRAASANFPLLSFGVRICPVSNLPPTQSLLHAVPTHCAVLPFKKINCSIWAKLNGIS